MIRFLKEFLNTFDEVHYFIAGISIGTFIGLFVAVGYLKSVHKWFFRKRDKGNS